MVFFLIPILPQVSSWIITSSTCVIMNEKIYINSDFENLKNMGLFTIELNQRFQTDSFQLNNTPLIQTNIIPNNNTKFYIAFRETQNGNNLYFYVNQGLNFFAWITHSGYFCIFGECEINNNELANECTKFNEVQSTKNGNIYKRAKFTPIAYRNYILIQDGSNTLNSTDPNYKLYNNTIVLNLDT
ncbi:hypothetical protein K502DRAFT_351729 [Neoconidiobolus thromboides FSU 785]|nr:hypothetical protein K502DRAFT_351729 [Neoconidiobolus thromboides FSU 785]